MDKYVAFLRGINLGKRSVKMEDLRKAFHKMGLEDAETLIASGNVLFKADKEPVVADIEAGLKDWFGFNIGTIIRSVARLEDMIGESPFSAEAAGPDVKFYLSLTAGPIGDRLEGVMSVPGDYEVIRVDEMEFYSHAYKQESGRYGPAMIELEKRFKDLTVTARNWNTIERMADKAAKSK